MLQKLMQTHNDLALALARFILGIVLFAHGAQKVLGWFGGFGITGTLNMFAKFGMPAGLVYFVMFVEFFGGLSMLFGLLSRLAGLGIVALMLGAIFTVHLQNGFFMNWMGNQKGEGFEFHLLVIAIAVLVMLRGAGALSLDRAISTKT
jgi:putative oxidoreductase